MKVEKYIILGYLRLRTYFSLENFDDLSELEYAKYEVRGSFDNSRELFIGPR